MRVVVTGGRDYSDYAFLARELDRLGPIEALAHGAAPGADALASRWCYERKVDVHAYGALWGTYGPSAGPKRNLEMLTDFKPDLVVGFPSKDSRGTWSCLRKSVELGIGSISFNAPADS